ncbi:calcium/manganese antiporter SLC30A10 isoform X1 [Paroedura picta]|uniref:calcium/manganese antiporter SLC30A10 isoform X1 n=1 Tax=Paroedura picta TaxID=143630 RepID=UPI004056DD10
MEASGVRQRSPARGERSGAGRGPFRLAARAEKRAVEGVRGGQRWCARRASIKQRAESWGALAGGACGRAWYSLPAGAMGRYTGQTCRLSFMLVLTAGFFVAELVSGYVGNSIALVSDSFSMLSDLIALCVGLATGRISRRRRRSPRASFGYGRAEVVGALSNAVFLAALYFTILMEALQRLARPEAISDAPLILVVGALGLAVNVVGLLVFQNWAACCPACCRPAPAPASPPSHDDESPPDGPDSSSALEGPSGRPPQRGQEGAAEASSEDQAGDPINTPKQPEEEVIKKKEKKSEALNIRGVLLHVMGDALGSVVVVVAASIFYVLPLDENTPCNWQCYIDPSLTVIMVIIILSSAFPLIKETAIILLQMVPKGVNMQILANKLSDVPGVSSIHEVHVWELVSGKNIATLHVKCHTSSDYQEASYRMREVFHEAGVHSVTIQPEYTDHKSPEILCSAPCISKACDPQLCCSQQEATLVQVGNGYKEKNGSITPSLKKAYKNSVEIPIEPIWAEDVVKKDKSKKDTLNETGNSRPYIHSTRF